MNDDDDALARLLARAGIGADAIATVQRVDGVMQTWRRRLSKRELANRAIAALGLKVELAQLDVLFAIAAPEPEFGCSGDETMVSTVAERLAIDPSRASRLVSDMVSAGHVRRAVSQADGRRAVLELTASGAAVVRAVQGYRWLYLGHFFSEWSEADRALFVPLLERFIDWTDALADETLFAAELAELAQNLARADEAGRDKAV